MTHGERTERVEGVTTPSGVKPIVRGYSHHAWYLLDLLRLGIKSCRSRHNRDIFLRGKPPGLLLPFNEGLRLLVCITCRLSLCKLVSELLHLFLQALRLWKVPSLHIFVAPWLHTYRTSLGTGKRTALDADLLRAHALPPRCRGVRRAPGGGGVSGSACFDGACPARAIV